MEQWQTPEEVAFELRVSRPTVMGMIRRGVLYGVKTGSNKWRIFPPSAKVRKWMLEREEHELYVPLFSSHEVAAVLGIKAVTLRDYVRCGYLTPEYRGGSGKPALFSAHEVRRFLWRREKLHRRGRKIYSPWLVKFLTAVLAAEAAPTVQQLDTLVAQVLNYLPKAERMPLLATFWAHLEGVNEVLRRVREARSKPEGRTASLRSGASAGTLAPPHSSAPGPA